MKESRKKYLTENPWLKSYFSIRKRCTQLGSMGYNYYGGKAIKCLLTIQDVRNLWFRDKANLMDKPNLHRKNHNKNYTISNCEFVEKKEHPKIKIAQINLRGSIVKRFNSVTEAAQEVGTVVSNISQVLKGRSKTAKGYRWKYA